MAHSQETRDTVRRLYIEGMPLNGAAVTAGVSYDTARDWKAKATAKGDDWDTARAAYRVSEQGVGDLVKQMVEDFSRQVVVTTREIEGSELGPAEKALLLAQLADAYSKFSKAFGKINPQYSGLSVALDTLKVIVDHLKTTDPTALRALYPHLDAIGGILGKRHG
jgi:hypothetical protein